MRNTCWTKLLLTPTIFSVAFWLTGCGQESARVALVEAEKAELEARIAELQASNANQSAADENKAHLTPVSVNEGFQGKIAKKIRGLSRMVGTEKASAEGRAQRDHFSFGRHGICANRLFRRLGQHAEHRQAGWRRIALQ